MIRYAYGTAFWSIKAEIGTPSPDTGRAEGECLYLATSNDLTLYQPITNNHFIVRPPTCLTDN